MSKPKGKQIFGTLLFRESADGDITAIQLENTQANSGGSVNETLGIKFGFGGITNAATIVIEKLDDFVVSGARSSAINFKLLGSNVEFSALYVSANDLLTVRPQIGIGTDGNTNLDIHTTLHMIENAGTTSTRPYRIIMDVDSTRQSDFVMRNDTGHIRFGQSGGTQFKIQGGTGAIASSFTSTGPFTLDVVNGRLGIGQLPDGQFNFHSGKGLKVTSANGTAGAQIRLLRYDNTNVVEQFNIEMNVQQRVEFKLTAGIPDMEFQWVNTALVKFHRFGDTKCGVFINGATATPAVVLHVNDDSGDPAPPTLTETTHVIINHSFGTGNNTGLLFQTGLTGTSRIMFGTKDTQILGSIEYDYADNFLAFTVNTNEVVRITSGGFMGLGATAAEQLLHLERIVDGGGVSVLVENSFVNASASTDETTNILFGFGGINDAGQIRVGKLNDFVDAADRDSFMALSILDGDVQAEAIRIEGSGGTKIGLYAVTPVVQASKISDPSGGATVDAESRTAINAIIDAMEGLGVSVAA